MSLNQADEEPYRQGCRSAAYGCPFTCSTGQTSKCCRIAMGTLPCPPSSRASHVMKSGVQSLCADTLRCPQSPSPVHHTLWVRVPHRPRITSLVASVSAVPLPRASHVMGRVAASAKRIHFLPFRYGFRSPPPPCITRYGSGYPLRPRVLISRPSACGPSWPQGS